ncbi:hypothetical protein BKA65DRAFT_582067, partial [Rhexocercosporidium sp. MPI-PUGE-AT-0058]
HQHQHQHQHQHKHRPITNATSPTTPLHPPSLAIHGAKLSAKIIALIIILIFVTLSFTSCLCYICIRRRRSKKRKRLLERERMESKQLKPRINARNARFFAPGLWGDGGRRGERVVKGEGEGLGRKGWKEGLRGKVDRGVLERWNAREREFDLQKGEGRGSLDKDFRVREIEMRDFRGVGVGDVRVGNEGGSGGGGGEGGRNWGVRMPERAWLRWGRR